MKTDLIDIEETRVTVREEREEREYGEEKESLKERALGYLETYKAGMDELSEIRKSLHKAYMGEKYGNEVEGRSQVVMTDVANTIEWLLPSLMRIFYGGSSVVELRPQGPEDEEKAKLMVEKINFDFQKRLPGYKILYWFFKDALIYKLGVVKYYWQKKKSYEFIEFNDLTESEFNILQMDPNVIVDDVSMRESERESDIIDPMFGTTQMIIDKKYNIKGRKIIEKGQPIVENLPPEEFIFDIKARSIEDSDLVAHRKKIRKKELIKYGLKEDEIDDEVDSFYYDEEISTRYKDLGGTAFITDDVEGEYVYIHECYLNDYDESGNPIPKKITLLGDRVISEEDNTYLKPPFCCISPLMISHRMVGRSIAELATEIQKVRTSLARYILDNVYFQNNGMRVVNPYRINTDDLLNGNIPGGIVRTKHDIDPTRSIFPVPITPLAPETIRFWEMSENIRENATGVTRYSQGIDAKSLNKTATGISQIMSASQQRFELVARTFAETGVRDIFAALVAMNIKFFDREEFVKINDKWRMVRPEDMSGEYDIIIDVGIGTGTNEFKINQLTQMLDRYRGLARLTGQGEVPVFTGENIKNILREMWQLMGYKNSFKFVNESNIPPLIQQPMQQMMPSRPMPNQMGSPMMGNRPMMPMGSPARGMPNRPMPNRGMPMVSPNRPPMGNRPMMPSGIVPPNNLMRQGGVNARPPIGAGGIGRGR